MAKRIEYGTTPWGRWFLGMLETYNFDQRLTRGRRYANNGMVHELSVTNNTVIAKVEGSYRPFYKVKLEFPPIKPEACAKITAFIDKKKLVQAAIKRGEFPQELIDYIGAQKIRLIPPLFSGLTRSCSCPDYGDPCKHQAAVLYILAKEIDQSPQFLFNLAGIVPQNAHGQKNSLPRSSILPPVVSRPWSDSRAAAKTDELNQTYNRFITSLLPKRIQFTQDSFLGALSEFYHHALKFCSAFFEITPDQNLSDKAGFSGWNSRQLSHARHFVVLHDKNLSEIFPLSTDQFFVNSEYQQTSHVNSLVLAAAEILSVTDTEGSPSFKAYRAVFKTLYQILHQAAFIPVPFQAGGELSIWWKPFTASAAVDFLVQKTARYLESLCAQHCLTPFDLLFKLHKTHTDKKPEWNALYATELLLCAALTQFVPLVPVQSASEMGALFFKNKIQPVNAPGQRTLGQSIQNWLAVLQKDSGEFLYRITVKTTEKETFSLSIQVKSATPDADFENLHKALKNAQNPAALLQFPLALTAYVGEINLLSEKASIPIDESTLVDFLHNALTLLQAFGVETVIPRSLKNLLVPRPVLSVSVKKAENLQSWFGLNDLLAFDSSLLIGGDVVSFKEFEALLAQNKRLVKFKDSFLLLDPKNVEQILKQAQRSEKTGPTHVLQAYLLKDALFTADAEKIIQQLFAQKEVPVPPDLQAALRPYQETGYQWLYSTLEAGFGCLLADDMGLGKTIQVIALLLRLKYEGKLENGALIVAPATLMTNWEREIARFAPGLSVSVYHSKNRALTRSDVTISTYQTITKDIAKLADKSFGLIVLDEAQNVKNAETKAGKAMRKLKTNRMAALTGTPVENRLEDLRSIFDLLIPGYLGNAKDFKNRWRIPIELHNNQNVAEDFKKITAPFLLRRLKTDKSIINDLPDKVIINQYAPLTLTQTALYETIVQNQLEQALKQDSDIARSGMIFKLLTALKQVCNHPRMYDKTSVPKADLSGKCGLLLTLLGEILEKGEKVLIFSQYVETLSLLSAVIQEELGETPLILTGQTSQKNRTVAVDAFQKEDSQNIFLISLKAGGTGLNLTAASRVIHYDLWYNPAVEDQATDRAFRLGQEKNVFVHRLISSGTFEEKIDAMIQSKRAMASLGVSTGETWLSKLTNDEIRQLFASA